MLFELPKVEPNSDEETLFRAIGFVVTQWGGAELTLDMIVSIIFPIVKSKHKSSKQPVMLTAKTQFIRTHLTEHPILKQYSPEVFALLTRFEAIGNKRNDLVHGAIMSLSPTNGAFKFAKLDIVKGEVPTLRSVFLNDVEWADFRNELMSLGADSILLVKQVLNEIQALSK